MTPYRAAEPFDWGGLLALVQTAFAGMEGRITPPSSMHALTAGGIAGQARSGEVWVIGAPPVACIFLTPKPDALYLGKLAVAASERGKGHARRLVDVAALRAKAFGLPAMELQSRIELVENHAIFRRLGFQQTGENAHPGFDRPTSMTFRRAVDFG